MWAIVAIFGATFLVVMPAAWWFIGGGRWFFVPGYIIGIAGIIAAVAWNGGEKSGLPVLIYDLQSEHIELPRAACGFPRADLIRLEHITHSKGTRYRRVTDAALVVVVATDADAVRRYTLAWNQLGAKRRAREIASALGVDLVECRTNAIRDGD